jgi:hypothetical protein
MGFSIMAERPRHPDQRHLSTCLAGNAHFTLLTPKRLLDGHSSTGLLTSTSSAGHGPLTTQLLSREYAPGWSPTYTIAPRHMRASSIFLSQTHYSTKTLSALLNLDMANRPQNCLMTDCVALHTHERPHWHLKLHCQPTFPRIVFGCTVSKCPPNRYPCLPSSTDVGGCDLLCACVCVCVCVFVCVCVSACVKVCGCSSWPFPGALCGTYNAINFVSGDSRSYGGMRLVQHFPPQQAGCSNAGNFFGRPDQSCNRTPQNHQ